MGRRNTSKQEKIEGMIGRYGIEILDDFEAVKTLPYSTLSAIGKKHGFSRERARQIYRMVFGKPYTNSRKKKRMNAKEEDTLSCRHDPRHKVCEYIPDCTVHTGAVYEKEFLEKCESKGFCVRPILKRTVDLRVNGHLVDVKYCSTPMQTSPYGPPYYRYHISKNQSKMCDFFACYHPGESAFFIIPNKYLPPKCGGGMIYIQAEPTLKSTYWQYKDAWHLLA